MRFFFVLGLVFLNSAGLIRAQNPGAVFFDQAGKSTSRALAFYYREAGPGGKGTYVSRYMNGNLAFEGNLLKASDTDESQNQYTGTCIWYHKNGTRRALRNFDAQGTEIGRSVYYYESGKINRVFMWEGGRLKGRKYEDFDEKGNGKRVFEERFSSNQNDWDLYASNKSKASLTPQGLLLESLTPAGTSRFIRVENDSREYAYEITLSMADPKKPVGGKYGLIFGFRDWQNYNFFLIQGQSIYVGEVFEGVTNLRANGFYAGILYPRPQEINLKVFSSQENTFFSINGEVQYKSGSMQLPGTGFGPALGGKGKVKIHSLMLKEFNIQGSGLSGEGSNPGQASVAEYTSSGSGFFIHRDGYLVTNHHVIDGAKIIDVTVSGNGSTKTYRAKKLVEDAGNDLAILKIEDPAFQPTAAVPFSFKTNPGYQVGAAIFSIGYPLQSLLGQEAKLVDGRISSRTGYQNSVSTFQTSVPVQPGSSGSPLFNDKGELIAVITSMVTNTDNVSYAVKLSFLQNLMDLLPTPLEPPSGTFPAGTSMEQMVKALTPYVSLIRIKK